MWPAPNENLESEVSDRLSWAEVLHTCDSIFTIGAEVLCVALHRRDRA